MKQDIVNKNVALLLEKKATKEQIYAALLRDGASVQAIEQALNKSHRPESKQQLQKRVIAIVVTIGAVLIGAGVLSFIASNWPMMGKPLKLSIIFVSMLGAYVSGWLLIEKKQMKHAGTALVLLGAIIYGAGIFLIGQMYHVDANWPEAMLLWMVGVIPIGIVIRSQSVLLLGLLTGVIGYLGLLGTPFDGRLSATASVGTLLLALTALIIAFFAGRHIKTLKQ